MSINSEDLIEVSYYRVHETMLANKLAPTPGRNHNADSHLQLLLRLIADTSQRVATVGQTEHTRRQPPKPRWLRWLTRHP